MRSHRKVEMTGIEGGPGGSLVELRKWLKMELRR